MSNNVLPLAFPPPRNTSCRNTFDDETTVGPIRWRDQNNTKKTTRPTNQLPSRALCHIVKLLRAVSSTEPLVDHVFYTHHNLRKSIYMRAAEIQIQMGWRSGWLNVRLGSVWSRLSAWLLSAMHHQPAIGENRWKPGEKRKKLAKTMNIKQT